jgi:hypothetical protein
VIIKALLPHRVTMSTMIISPRLSRRYFIFPGRKNACRKSQNRAKVPLFAALCSKRSQRIRARYFGERMNSRQINVLLFGASGITLLPS